MGNMYTNFPYKNRSSFRRVINRNRPKPLSFSIYGDDLNVMAGEALKKKKEVKETGGALFGMKTRSNEFVILLATPPGVEAYHSKYTFQMDLNFLRKVDKHVKDLYKLDHFGDWHTHILDLLGPSQGDINSTHVISKKNDYDRYIQLIITIPYYGGKKYIKFNPYIYTDAKSGPYHPCRMNVLPGTSPIRSALTHRNEFPELAGDKSLIETSHFILPSEGTRVFSSSQSSIQSEQIFNRRLEQQLLKLPSEVLCRIEIVEKRGVTVTTIPLLDSDNYLYFVYIQEFPYQINSVYFVCNSKDHSPVDVTSKALEFGAYMKIKVIWSRYMRFIDQELSKGGENNDKIF